MAGNQLYEQAAIFLDKNSLAEVESFDVTHVSGASNIVTMVKGFAGISPGAKMTQITGKSAIPRAGLEYDAIDKLQNDTEVEVVYFRAGKKVSCKGFITECKEQYSASNPSAFDFTFVGVPVKESTL